jgi:hypothetical protein
LLLALWLLGGGVEERKMYDRMVEAVELSKQISKQGAGAGLKVGKQIVSGKMNQE